MNDRKDSFVLHLDMLEDIDEMTEKEKADFLDFVVKYNLGLMDLDDISDGPTKRYYRLFANQFDRDHAKWLKTKEKRSEAGKMGGRPSKKQSKAKKANGFSEKQTKAKKAVNVNVNGNVNENINVNGNVKGRASSSKEVIDYCLSIGLTEADGVATWEKWNGNGWINGKSKIKDWKATIRSWKAAGYMPSQRNPELRKASRTSPAQTEEKIGELEQY